MMMEIHKRRSGLSALLDVVKTDIFARFACVEVGDAATP